MKGRKPVSTEQAWGILSRTCGTGWAYNTFAAPKYRSEWQGLTRLIPQQLQVLDDKCRKAGFFGDDLRDELARHPLAGPLLWRYQIAKLPTRRLITTIRNEAERRGEIEVKAECERLLGAASRRKKARRSRSRPPE